MAALTPESPAPPAKAPGSGRDLAVAVPTALGLIVLLLASVIFGPWPLVGLVVVALALALRELTQALARVGLRVPYLPLVVGAVFTQLAAAWSGPPGVVVGIFLTLAAGLAWRVLEGESRPAPDAAGPVSANTGGLVQDLYATAFTTVYLPTLAALVVLLGFLPDGRWLVLLLVAVPVASDTGGYFAGSAFGKHKLAPRISPKKTWEGLAGSVLLALVAGVGGMALMGRP
jgi:phosphatidate cytidylyltransferase